MDPDSRRQFLKQAALVTGSAVLGRILPACGPAPVGGTLDVTEARYSYLSVTGLPDHPTGVFPNPGCPNAISERDRILRFPARPVVNPEPIPIQSWEFGVALNGVSLDPAGPYWKGDQESGWHFEVTSKTARTVLGLDENEAHSQPGGRYHYHGLPNVLLERGEADRAAGKMHLLGWAADGFPIYSPYGHANPRDPKSPLVELLPSYRLRQGLRGDGAPPGPCDGTFVQDYDFIEGLGDLDAANSRFGATAEYPEGTVYYVFTRAFPYISRLYRGTPDPSFANPTGPSGNNGLPPALRDYQG